MGKGWFSNICKLRMLRILLTSHLKEVDSVYLYISGPNTANVFYVKKVLRYNFVLFTYSLLTFAVHTSDKLLNSLSRFLELNCLIKAL